jgi:hypothetical protein
VFCDTKFINFSFEPLHPSSWSYQADWSSGNAVDSYSGGCPFESRTGLQLSCLKFVFVFPQRFQGNGSTVLRSGHDRFYPDSFQFMFLLSSYNATPCSLDIATVIKWPRNLCQHQNIDFIIHSLSSHSVLVLHESADGKFPISSFFTQTFLDSLPLLSFLLDVSQYLAQPSHTWTSHVSPSYKSSLEWPSRHACCVPVNPSKTEFLLNNI